MSKHKKAEKGEEADRLRVASASNTTGQTREKEESCSCVLIRKKTMTNPISITSSVSKLKWRSRCLPTWGQHNLHGASSTIPLGSGLYLEHTEEHFGDGNSKDRTHEGNTLHKQPTSLRTYSGWEEDFNTCLFRILIAGTLSQEAYTHKQKHPNETLPLVIPTESTKTMCFM